MVPLWRETLPTPGDGDGSIHDQMGPSSTHRITSTWTRRLPIPTPPDLPGLPRLGLGMDPRMAGFSCHPLPLVMLDFLHGSEPRTVSWASWGCGRDQPVDSSLQWQHASARSANCFPAAYCRHLSHTQHLPFICRKHPESPRTLPPLHLSIKYFLLVGPRPSSRGSTGARGVFTPHQKPDSRVNSSFTPSVLRNGSMLAWAHTHTHTSICHTCI